MAVRRGQGLSRDKEPSSRGVFKEGAGSGRRKEAGPLGDRVGHSQLLLRFFFLIAVVFKNSVWILL